MHQFIMNIGSAVYGFLSAINTANLMVALKIVGNGMLGIFIVTGVIILSTTLLNKIFSKTKE